MFKENPFRFPDPKAQAISDRWHQISLGPRQTGSDSEAVALVEKLNQCGIAYLTDFFGFDQSVVNGFLEEDWRAWHTVGMRQSAVQVTDENVRHFWQKVNTIYPNLHNPEEIEFLAVAGVYAVLQFMGQIDRIGSETSPVIRKINVNAHVYK